VWIIGHEVRYMLAVQRVLTVPVVWTRSIFKLSCSQPRHRLCTYTVATATTSSFIISRWCIQRSGLPTTAGEFHTIVTTAIMHTWMETKCMCGCAEKDLILNRLLDTCPKHAVIWAFACRHRSKTWSRILRRRQYILYLSY
jgi:hypothetical protein